MPVFCGFTTPMHKIAAIAESTAFPPRNKTFLNGKKVCLIICRPLAAAAAAAAVASPADLAAIAVIGCDRCSLIDGVHRAARRRPCGKFLAYAVARIVAFCCDRFGELLQKSLH